MSTSKRESDAWIAWNQADPSNTKARNAHLRKMVNDSELDSEKFHAAIGRVVANWSKVETYLYRFFLLGLGSPHRRPISAAYHTVVNFQARLQMVDNALKFRIKSKKLSTQWATLHTRIRRKEKHRNTVAHSFPVYDMRRVPGQIYHLRDSPYNENKSPSGKVSPLPSKVLLTSDIVEIYKETNALIADLEVFAKRLETHCGRSSPI